MVAGPSVVKVTKQEAALSQLDQAIRLLFSHGDMLSVHTLTAAAFGLLADLAGRSRIVSRYRSQEIIRPGRLKEWRQALKRTENFLKHADRDPDVALRYVEEGTVLLVYEAVELAERMRIPESDERIAFKLWFVFSFPELVQPAAIKRLRAANHAKLDETDKDLWAEWLRLRAVERPEL